MTFTHPRESLHFILQRTSPANKRFLLFLKNESVIFPKLKLIDLIISEYATRYTLTSPEFF